MCVVKKVSWPEWAKWVQDQLKDHQAKLKDLKEQVEKIGADLAPIRLDHLETELLELLRAEEKPRTWRWIANRLGHDAWRPLTCLIRKGLVTTTIKGNRTMYVAAEA